MARFTLAPVTLALEDGTLQVPSGVTVATLLPLTNRSAAEGLDQWDPGRWNGPRLRTPNGLAVPELVTVFGHGGHSCPARPFSLSAMTRASHQLLDRFDWEPTWSVHPEPVRAQIGGVARAAAPCVARYTQR
jgi:cytochrome P450